ncbi:MAG: hypothetical protein DRJ65_00085 [Acidobacteria bacterium]|nr:MAG: hypothetical protein DRJ65_00085 [Acidobacteriota bacterium]
MSGSFELQLKAFEDKVPEVMTKVIKKVGLELYMRIVIKTPVDTGRARGNWLIASGVIPQGVVDTLATAPNVAMALSTLASYDSLSGMSIFIANNLDYINALEHGHSGQAPEGMVQLTLTEFEGIVKKAAKKSNP